MGNSSSTSVLRTHASTPCTSTFSETRHPLSVSPFKLSTFVSITKTSSKTSSSTPSAARTEEYCSWDWESDTFSCSSWTLTFHVPTPFTVPTPTLTPSLTGGYETSETSPSFPDYTCTDLLCINSVLSEYEFSMCPITATTDYGFPTETWSWPESSTSDASPASHTSCDLFRSEDCSRYTIEPTTTEPTDGAPTIIWPTETSSDCDSEVTSSTSTDYCGDGSDCWTSIAFTIPESEPTPYGAITKHSYSYRRSSTRRTSTSTTSDCDFWDFDCTPAATGEVTTQGPNPDPGRHHTTSTPHPLPRQSAEAKK
ncbi:hypothetical protein GGS24DRAFT_476628 [Hypoxylon argillaceum]|nr:hypothetical protein GGS24DRAFT_476628 [Hypoxylon argillaceum]